MKLICGVPGAGKTERAVLMAKECEGQALYLSFSSENTKNSQARFQGLATCASIHAFARRLLNIPKERLCDQWGTQQLQELNNQSITDIPASLMHVFLDLFFVFITSDTPISRARSLMVRREFFLVSESDKAVLLSTLLKTWDAMWRESSKIKLTHDMYLKRATEVVSSIPFQLVLVDEVQDLNESMMAFIEAIAQHNPDCEIVLMGDRSQQIFGYRGVSKKINTMTPFDEMTTTRRFGMNVATLLNEFMKAQCLAYYTKISHSLTQDTQVMETPGWSVLFAEAAQGRKMTVITRLNMSIWLLAKHLSDSGVKFAVKGSPLRDIAALEDLFLAYKNNRKDSRHQYQRYKDRAVSTNDANNITACKLIESIPLGDTHFFNRLRQCLVDERTAQVLLTNIHQAKGLQFHDVILAGDFQTCVEVHTGKAFKIPSEEAHAVYTAISRCRTRLTLPKDWMALYRATQKNK